MSRLDHARGVYISCVPGAERVNQESTGAIVSGGMHPSRRPVIRTSTWMGKLLYDGSHKHVEAKRVGHTHHDVHSRCNAPIGRVRIQLPELRFGSTGNRTVGEALFSKNGAHTLSSRASNVPI